MNVQKRSAVQEDIHFESDSESDEAGDHDHLLSSVIKLHKSPRSRSQQTSEITSNVSEFAFNEGKVSVGDLLRGEAASSSTVLRRRLESVSKKKKSLESPLPDVYTREIERGIAYKKTSETVERWDPIVKHNRQAPHMVFPIQKDDISLPSLTTKVETFTPSCDYEKQIAAMVSASQESDMLSNDDVTKSLQHVDLKEVKQRRKELMKMRALMSYHEMKHKRLRKIKSKRFHRIQRKRQAAESDDSVPNAIEKAEILRAKERMTLKHTKMAKWAKRQLSRGVKDPAKLQALTEHYQRKEKVAKHTESDSDESDDNPSTCVTQDNMHNPWIGAKVKSSVDAGSLSISTSNYMQVDDHKASVGEGEDSLVSTIHEAFAGDEVTQQFEEESSLETNKTTQLTETALPGWGSWSGESLGPKKKTVRSNFKRPPARGNHKNVIMNERRDQKLEKHLVSAVPWPYNNVQQFEKTHRTPLGRHWNTETTFHKLIKPQVIKTPGAAITPIKLTEDIEEFMSKRARHKHKQ